MAPLPALREFRTETSKDGVLHLIFDLPGRSMNVFTNAAIHELVAFADWLGGSDIKGVVVRSGKASAFCAGADLGELGVAYDMIVAASPAEQKRVARDHFAPIGRAFRKLETAGKPVAAAINGLALGGGCELALACHYRVLADTPQTALGLPESLVGLLPGGGGTQRMPRLVGVERSLPVLLDGARFSPAEAVAAGAANEVVPAGEEVAAAERWVLNNPTAMQPWDAPTWRRPNAGEVAATLAPVREKILRETGGHYPAPLAILDCVGRGLPQPMDEAIVTEIDIFADLIKRPEPRNMIQTLFLGKQDYDKRRKAGALPAWLDGFVSAIRLLLGEPGAAELARIAGFRNDGNGSDPAAAAKLAARADTWIDEPASDAEIAARRLMAKAALAASEHSGQLPEDERRLADYATVKELGFPSYLGGPFALLGKFGTETARKLAER